MNWNSRFLSEINYQIPFSQLIPTYYYPSYVKLPLYPIFQQINTGIISMSDQNIQGNQNQSKIQRVSLVSNRKIKKVKENIENLAKSQEKKKNIRNIIPNLSRKILKYLSSEKSKQFLTSHFPNISKNQIEEYYEYTNIQKNSFNFYVGKKDLKRIWCNSQDDPNFLMYSRFLSKEFLNNRCINWILLSKKMKQSLKMDHLRYRRKLLKILNGICEKMI